MVQLDIRPLIGLRRTILASSVFQNIGVNRFHYKCRLNRLLRYIAHRLLLWYFKRVLDDANQIYVLCVFLKARFANDS